MSDQHYGRAPCKCHRPDPATMGPLDGVQFCASHLYAGGFDGITPWAVAEALEAGLRAIALAPSSYNIGGIWYGCAPCSCRRGHDSPADWNICDEHNNHSLPVPFYPWDCAGGVANGLRAIAGWSPSRAYERRIQEASDNLDEALARLQRDFTEAYFGSGPGDFSGVKAWVFPRPTMPPNATVHGAPVWKDQYLPKGQYVEVEGGGSVISVQDFAELEKRCTVAVESKPSTRLCCYHCGFQINGAPRCPRCDNEQPPGA